MQHRLIEARDPVAINAIGDWFEAEGRKWEDRIAIPNREENSDLGAYFALKVAAAGWHSAALVLVDEEKAEQARQSHIRKPDDNKQDQSEERQSKGAAERSGQAESVASDETVEAPWDQFTEALHRVREWVWGVVCQRPFLHFVWQRISGLGAIVAGAFPRRLGVLERLSDALFPLAGYLAGLPSADDVVPTQGRSFLGLSQRDELAEEGEGAVRYVWEEDELPLLLELEDGG